MGATKLPFSIVDETFVHTDDRAEPVTVQIEAQVTGALDDDRLRRAVDTAMRHHPLSRARLEPWTDETLAYEWIIDDEPQADPLRTRPADADTDLDAVRSDFYSEPLTLFESPPLRVLHVPRPDGDRVMVSIHHSASDGMGALRWLQSLLRALADADDPLPDFDLVEARRLAVPASGPTLGDRVRTGRLELQRLTRLGPLPARLSSDGETTHPGYGFTTMRLPLAPIVTAPLREATGATVNDVLIAAASLTAGRWIADHGGRADRVVVHMPINARPAEWSREVVANMVIADTASTTARERSGAESCLRAVAGWTEAVKQRGPGPAVAVLHSLPKFPVAGRRAATQWAKRAGGALADTLVLSNLGRIPGDFVEGEGLELAEVCFSPPAPMPYGLGIGAAALGDKLVLTLRHRWALWSSSAAGQFGQLLAEELDWLSSTSPS